MRRTILFMFFIIFCASGETRADAKPKQNPVQAKSKTVAAAPVTAPSAKPSILNTPIRKPASLDPNAAVEVRGQARTLSMMLVLKNGKDAINFIKPRKDYRPEIAKTEF